jgi:hypothetical protein
LSAIAPPLLLSQTLERLAFEPALDPNQNDTTWSALALA